MNSDKTCCSREEKLVAGRRRKYFSSYIKFAKYFQTKERNLEKLKLFILYNEWIKNVSIKFAFHTNLNQK